MNDIVDRASHGLGSTLLPQELLHLPPGRICRWEYYGCKSLSVNRRLLAGRHRYGALASASGGGAAPPREVGTWSPQAQEAARRAYMAGMAHLCTCMEALTDCATSFTCESQHACLWSSWPLHDTASTVSDSICSRRQWSRA